MIDRIEEEGETVFQHNYEEYYGGSQIARSRVVASLDGEFWAYDSGERQPSGPFPDLRSALTENSVVEGSPDIFLAVGSNTDRIWSALSTEELLDLLDVSGLEPGARLEVDGTIFNLLDVSWLDSWVTPLEDRFGPMPPTVTVTRTEQRRTTVTQSGPSIELVREEPLVFSGSLMNGTDIDLLRFAGIRFWLFSDEQHDALWSDTSELGLLEECWSVDRDSLGTNEIPLYSDEYFEFTVSSPIRFQAELRNIISERLNLSDEDWEEVLGGGAPEEEQPPQAEEVEILESVAVEDEPELITQETVSAVSTEPESIATQAEALQRLGKIFRAGGTTLGVKNERIARGLTNFLWCPGLKRTSQMR